MLILGLEKMSMVDYEGYICATIFTGGCNFFCPFCHNGELVKRELEPISENEVLDYLFNRRSLLDAITISGGEPTLQNDLALFIDKVKKMGYKIKLDTNGARPEVLEELIKTHRVDYVAMDVKNNFSNYLKITGLKIDITDKIKRSLEILKNSKVKYELRTTLVEGFHTEANMRKLAHDLEGHKKLYLQRFVEAQTCIKDGLSDIKKNKLRNLRES